MYIGNIYSGLKLTWKTLFLAL